MSKKAQGDVFKCLLSKKQSKTPKRYLFYYHMKKQQIFRIEKLEQQLYKMIQQCLLDPWKTETDFLNLCFCAILWMK